jgi:hypothetical protein
MTENEIGEIVVDAALMSHGALGTEEQLKTYIPQRR